MDAADFFPHTKEDVDKLYAKLLEIVALGRQSLAAATSRQRRPGSGNCSAPETRARRQSHASRYSRRLARARHQPVRSCAAWFWRIIRKRMPICLLTGAVLHDIGKLEELSYERSIGYTDEGQLLGHILIEYETGRQENGCHRGISARAENAGAAHADLAITGNTNSVLPSFRCFAKR